MHVVSYQGGLESSKNIVHGRHGNGLSHVQRACRPVESRGRFSPFQVQPAAPSPDRRVAARVISTRLNRSRFKQHQLQDQMVLQDLMPKLTGVGSALPHLQDCVYLDYNATTPIYPEVTAAMQPFTSQRFGNPSSVHTYGLATRAAVDKARQQVAALINCWADELAFTSCGTEADNWAIWGSVMARKDTVEGTPHVVTSAVEHPAVTKCLQQLQQLGLCSYTSVPVDAAGLVDPADVVAALTPDTVLVTVMHSNNEVGTIQPIAAIARAVKAANPNILVHTDAAQSMGRLDLDVQGLGVDLLTLVGHKFGAPKGVGALFIKRGVKLVNLLSGGSQEAGRRGGTENVLLLVGLGAAAELAFTERSEQQQHMRSMRDRLAAGLLAIFPREIVQINGPQDSSLVLPNTLSISIKGLAAPSLLQMLQDKLAASAGAACHSSKGASVSPVLQAMKLGPVWAVGTLRLSTGRHTTADEIDRAVQLIYEAAVKQGVIAAHQEKQDVQAGLHAVRN